MKNRVGSAAAVVCWTLILGSSVFPGHSAGSAFPAGQSIKGLVVPIYVAGHNQAAVVVRIDQVHQEYRRRAFFRIGLLPMMVGEKVIVELRDNSAQGLAALTDANRILGTKVVHESIELRQVEFSCPKATASTLRVGRINFSAGGDWILSDGVLRRGDKEDWLSATGILRMTGSHRGEVEWSSPKGEHHLGIYQLLVDNNGIWTIGSIAILK